MSDYKVGDEIIDSGCPDYGIGIVVKVFLESMTVKFENNNRNTYRNFDDPELRKVTKLDKALK